MADETQVPDDDHAEYCSLKYAQGLFKPAPGRHTFWRLERRGKLRAYRFSDSPRAPKFYKIAELNECFGRDDVPKRNKPA